MAVEADQSYRDWKIAQAAEIVQVFEGIDTLLRQPFEMAERPVAPSPKIVDEAEICRRHQARALAGIGVLQRAERSRAKEQADLDVDAEIAERLREGERARIQLQREWNAVWERLLDNDLDVVLQHLDKAFEDNEAPVAPISIDGSVIDVVVLVPGMDSIPTRKPRIGISGRLTWPVLTKTERSAYYEKMVCGHLLNTIRQTLAVAPGIKGATAAVVRFADPVFYGTSRLECLLAAHFTRERLADVEWDTALAPQIVFETSSDLRIKQAGRTNELQPLDLSEEPDILAVLEELDGTPDSDASSKPQSAATDRDSGTPEGRGTRYHGVEAFAVEDLDLFRYDHYECTATVNEVVANMPAFLLRLLRDPVEWFFRIDDEHGHRLSVLAEENGRMCMEAKPDALSEAGERLSKKDAAALRLLGWRTFRQEPGRWMVIAAEPDPVEEVGRVHSTLTQVFKLDGDDLMNVALVTQDTIKKLMSTE